MPKRFRQEQDSIGKIAVPRAAWYGAQTARALQLYRVSGQTVDPELIVALLDIKEAAAAANAKAGTLAKVKSRAIILSVQQLRQAVLRQTALFRDNFQLDAFHSGAGTSLHMNVNEVVANLANVKLGGGKGVYDLVHPNDHVNCGQSTNDVFPTALRIAAYRRLQAVQAVCGQATKVLAGKSRAFSRVWKAGRTHLQDALPLTLGSEFFAYAEIVHQVQIDVAADSKALLAVGLGGTAVGSGATAHLRYRQIVVKELRRITGLPLTADKNLFAAMQSMRPFVRAAAVLSGAAVEVGKISDDLRLLASGPMTGFAEINFPAVQPGSSIMAGKVNPSLLEMLNMVCLRVRGNYTTVSAASAAGQLELNVMMPVIAHTLLESARLLENSLRITTQRCFAGISANRAACLRYAKSTLALSTLLNQRIGYAASAALVAQARKTGVPMLELLRQRKLMRSSEIDKLFA